VGGGGVRKGRVCSDPKRVNRRSFFLVAATRPAALEFGHLSLPQAPEYKLVICLAASPRQPLHRPRLATLGWPPECTSIAGPPLRNELAATPRRISERGISLEAEKTMATRADQTRELTFLQTTSHGMSGFDYRASASESREQAVAVESVAVSFLIWVSVGGFAIWFLFWVAGSLGHIVSQVVR
jgi:hypothetical protein